MDMSRKGLEFLRQREASRNQAYQDNVGVWTIGVGHTAAAGPPKPVRGMRISDEEITAILAHDLVQYEDAVEKAIKVPMKQNEFDAMVSLCFNIGTGAFSKSSVVRWCNTGNKRKAADSFLLWNKGGRPRRVIKGLTNRRNLERTMFLGG